MKEAVIPNQISLEQIELADFAQPVDDGRAAEDPFKLPADLRTLLDTRLADLKTKDTATQLTEGGRATASATLRAALGHLIVNRSRILFLSRVAGIDDDPQQATNTAVMSTEQGTKSVVEAGNVVTKAEETIVPGQMRSNN